MLPVCIYDDGRGPLAPLTDLRAAFDVRTGALTNLERLRGSWGVEPAWVRVPEGIAALVREAHPRLEVNRVAGAGDVLAVNGRWTGPYDGAARSLKPGTVLMERGTGEVLAGAVAGRDLPRLLAGDLAGLTPVEHDSPERQVLARPWHVRSFRDRALRTDLRLLIAAHSLDAPTPGVHVDSTARIHPSVVFDTEHGPVVIAEGAAVRPGAVVIGPVYIGPHSTVLERAVIRPGTALGPWCKAAGEVSGVIFQGYSNKAHEGFLGDSWVGEWVNLGAGTTNSNLLNTYGEVIARALPDGPNERTGEAFLGAVLGDHTKTAIGTRIMTGAVVHTGTMWAASAPLAGTPAQFMWATDEGRRQFRLTKFLETARAMMARRSVTPTPVYEARIAELHAAAAADAAAS